MNKEIKIFEKPLLPGWIYPCTVEDIRTVLESIPPDDIRGLDSIGLVPSTRKNWANDGKYFGGRKPLILLYSIYESLSYRLSARSTLSDIHRQKSVELAYGMSVEKRGSRWWCIWNQNDLRQYVLQYVLIHEIGHHVCHLRRSDKRLVACPGERECEQFAEAYALRSRTRCLGPREPENIGRLQSGGPRMVR